MIDPVSTSYTSSAQNPNSRSISQLLSEKDLSNCNCMSSDEEKRSSYSETPSSDDSDDDDCLILDEDPDKPVKVSDDKVNYGGDDLVIFAEKGQIACRDYPHARHVCARFPFNTHPHAKFCDQCYCYICDKQAPCEDWGNGKSGSDHCHSTDKMVIWRVLRKLLKHVPLSQLPGTTLPNASPPYQAFSQTWSDEEWMMLLNLKSSLTVQPVVKKKRLTGKVKSFDSEKGYGFITPDSGGEDLFVERSSIKSQGRQSLYKEETVEFLIESGEGGRNKAVDVSGPGGTVLLESRSLLLDQPIVQKERLTGKVKWFNSYKGYGFIIPESGDEDLFVHRSAIKSQGYQSLEEGETVEFQIESGEDGRNKAIDVSCPGGSFVRNGSGNNFERTDTVECYKCGERGHIARNCLNVDYYTCGESGHLSRFGESVKQNTDTCYKCGDHGHWARDCYDIHMFIDRGSSDSNSDLGCQSLDEGETVEFQIESGEDGRNKAVDVSRPGGSFIRNGGGNNFERTDTFECYKCGEIGHIARNCLNFDCYACGESGHLAICCESVKKIRGACYKCGDHGHWAKDCFDFHMASDRGSFDSNSDLGCSCGSLHSIKCPNF